MELGAQTRSLDQILGTPETSLFHIQDVLAGRSDVAAATGQVPGYDNLFLLPTGHGLCPPVGAREFLQVLDMLSELDYVIVDGVDPRWFPAAAADLILQVVTPEPMAVHAAAPVTRFLFDMGANEIRLVINRVPPSVPPMKGINDFDDIIDIVGARLIGVIPQSQKLMYASNNTEALGEDSLTPQVFERIAARIMGKDAPLLIY
jgi:septum site-determining protein MinD